MFSLKGLMTAEWQVLCVGRGDGGTEGRGRNTGGGDPTKGREWRPAGIALRPAPGMSPAHPHRGTARAPGVTGHTRFPASLAVAFHSRPLQGHQPHGEPRGRTGAPRGSQETRPSAHTVSPSSLRAASAAGRDPWAFGRSGDQVHQPIHTRDLLVEQHLSDFVKSNHNFSKSLFCSESGKCSRWTGLQVRVTVTTLSFYSHMCFGWLLLP